MTKLIGSGRCLGKTTMAILESHATGNQIFTVIYICAEVARIKKRRRGYSDMHLFCPCIPEQLNYSSAGGTPYNRIINHYYSFSGNRFFHCIKLYS